MLVEKNVQVEKEISDVMDNVVGVIAAIKGGKPLADVAIEELVKLGSVIASVQAIPADVKESASGSVKAAFLGAVDIVALLVKP